MANRFRGEVDITLGNEVYIMRPTFQALCEIEEKTGKTIFALLEEISSQNLLLRAIPKIIQPAIKAGGKEIDEEKIKELLHQPGLVEIIKLIIKFFKYGLGIADDK